MRAWLMDGYDGIEKMRLAEVEDPKPGRGEVLLRVRYAALNPADAFLARGMYPAKPALPHILGRDAVGEVVAAGAGVEWPKVGESAGILRCEVGVNARGALADLVVAPACSLAPIPHGWSAEEMAAAPLVFLTAWQALTQWSEPEAPPKAGSVVLVTGASGGVGVATVLLGKSMGLTVVGLSRSAEKGEKLKELGADAVFSPDDRDLRTKVMAAIAPKRVDIAVDSIAALSSRKWWQCWDTAARSAWWGGAGDRCRSSIPARCSSGATGLAASRCTITRRNRRSSYGRKSCGAWRRVGRGRWSTAYSRSKM
jgi:NADPH2:quinone reductase